MREPNGTLAAGEMSNKRELIEALRLARPDIAIEVTRVIDDYADWDEEERGEARPEDCEPYILIVKAYAIREGWLLEGESTLSESWCRPGDPEDNPASDECDFHGYLPQMIDEALENLDEAISKFGSWSTR